MTVGMESDRNGNQIGRKIMYATVPMQSTPLRVVVEGRSEPRSAASDTLTRLGTTIALERGRLLYDAGDPADHFYAVVEGTVRSARMLYDGRRQIIDFSFPGEWFGFEGDMHRTSCAEAVSDCTLIRYPRRAIEAELGKDPQLMRRLISALSRDLRHAQDRVLLLGRKTAQERIASFLLEVVQRTAGASGTVALSMSRNDIADFLGLTTETVSRVITRLKVARLIRLLPKNRIQLLDRARLEAMTESEYDNGYQSQAA
jgi:CRP-like cAMP-binding protein